MFSQNDHDEEDVSDGWDWTNYFFEGFDLQEPEVADHGIGDVHADENQEEEIPADESFFPRCPMTLKFSAVLIMEFLVRHKLSQKAADNPLELLTAHFPQGHRKCTSLYKFKSYWKDQSSLLEYDKRLVCSSCETILPKNKQLSIHPGCLDVSLPPIVFLVQNIETALGQLLREPRFCSELVRTFEKQSCELSDIVNGAAYKNATRNGYHLTPWDITMTLNTDGVSIFKTSRSGSLWPVYLTVNELPAISRYSLKYVILHALWFQPSKPPIQAILDPLIQQLFVFSRKCIKFCNSFAWLLWICHMCMGTVGAMFDTARGMQPIRAKLALVTGDLPATA
jgi:hypothetical protein